MKKFFFVFWFFLFSAVAGAEECEWDSGVCFGIDWSTAAVGDIGGIDVNAREENGRTPLHWASGHNNNPKVISALIDSGANISARTTVGTTPLHHAAGFNKNPEIIFALIDAGADINARKMYDWTPLHWAAGHNDTPEIISALVDAGADINGIGNNEYTPLHVAVQYNDSPQIVEKILAEGGNPEIKTNYDSGYKTAYDLIKENEALKGTSAYWKLNDLHFE